MTQLFLVLLFIESDKMSYTPYEDSSIFNIQAQKASSISTQAASSTFVDLTASDITYNCDSNSSKVIYEYTTSFSRNTTNTQGVVELKLVQYNTSTSLWEDVNSSQYITYGFGTALGYPRNNKTFTFAIDSWLGNKQIKLQWKKISGALDAHRVEQIFYLSNTSEIVYNYITKPFLVVYSVRE